MCFDGAAFFISDKITWLDAYVFNCGRIAVAIVLCNIYAHMLNVCNDCGSVYCVYSMAHKLTRLSGECQGAHIGRLKRGQTR